MDKNQVHKGVNHFQSCHCRTVVTFKWRHMLESCDRWSSFRMAGPEHITHRTLTAFSSSVLDYTGSQESCHLQSVYNRFDGLIQMKSEE